MQLRLRLWSSEYALGLHEERPLNDNKIPQMLVMLSAFQHEGRLTAEDHIQAMEMILGMHLNDISHYRRHVFGWQLPPFCHWWWFEEKLELSRAIFK